MKLISVRLSCLILPFITAQLLSCSAGASYVARHVVTTLGTEILVRCTFDDCLGKSANAAAGTPEHSLEQTIQDYYALINQEKYDIAWSYLSPGYRERSEKKGGYIDYVEWWETIDTVSIKDTELLEGSEGQVYVDASLKYFKNNDKDFSQLLRLSFVWDSPNNRWAIESVEMLSES